MKQKALPSYEADEMFVCCRICSKTTPTSDTSRRSPRYPRLVALNKENNNEFLVPKVMLLTVFVCGPVMADTDTQPLLLLDELGNPTAPVDGSWSHLTRTDDMLLLTAEVSGLEPSDAMTLWWFIVNSGCSAGGDCTVLANASGNIVGNIVKSDGTLEFGAVLREREADALGHQVVFANTDYGEVVTDVDSSFVILAVQSHGQTRGGKQLREQVSELEANCTPSCVDVQISFHAA